MSIIIGYKKGNKIWMAGDSRVAVGSHVDKLVDSTAKIWQENNVIIGGVGLLNELQLMRYTHPIPLEDVVLGKVDAEYLYFLYSGFGAAFLEHFGVTLEPNVGYGQVLSSSFMFAVNGQLFVLDSSGSVMEYDKFEAIGCANDLVRGYLLGHQDEEDIEKLLTDAINYAATMDNGIDTNISIYSLEFQADDEELAFENELK